MGDIYFPHPKWGKYASNINGVVMRVDKNKIVPGHLHVSGYTILTFCDTSKPRGRQSVHLPLHRFVCECFNKTIPDGHHVDHINGNKGDNRLANLQPVSPQHHARKTARDHPSRGSKIALARMIPILRIDSAGNTKQYASLREGQEDTPGSCMPGISVASRSNNTISHAGYKWAQAQPVKEEGEIWASPFLPKWRPLTVSTSGRVQLPKGPMTKGHEDGRGYLRIGHKGQKVYVHTLVCATFLGQKPDAMSSVDHIDGCTRNNNLNNLRWASKTQQANNTKANRCIAGLDVASGRVTKWKGVTAASRALRTSTDSINRYLRSKKALKGFLLEVEHNAPVKL